MFPEALYESNKLPTNIGNKIPPTAPAIPPMPTTELTASFGNISDAVVNILVAHAWCTATAMLINTTAIHALVANCARIIDISIKAKMNHTLFLAFNTGQPFFISHDDKYPPPKLPMVV